MPAGIHQFNSQRLKDKAVYAPVFSSSFSLKSLFSASFLSVATFVADWRLPLYLQRFVKPIRRHVFGQLFCHL
jgi:hypothetical protein